MSKRDKLRERDGDGCFFCGNTIQFHRSHNYKWGPTIHHVIPKRDGGSNALDNLKLAHCRCHREHHGLEGQDIQPSRTYVWDWPQVTPGRERLPL